MHISLGKASLSTMVDPKQQCLPLVLLFFFSHIHWYERTFPLGRNGTIDKAAIVDNNTFYANEGKSLTHIINGMAGNIESHAELAKAKKPLDITCIFDQTHYGFSKLTVVNETVLTWSFVKGGDGSSGDDLTLIRRPASHSSTSSSSPSASAPTAGVTVVTETVDSYTTYCPGPTTITEGTHTYTVSEVAFFFSFFFLFEMTSCSPTCTD